MARCILVVVHSHKKKSGDCVQITSLIISLQRGLRWKGENEIQEMSLLWKEGIVSEYVGDKGLGGLFRNVGGLEQ